MSAAVGPVEDVVVRDSGEVEHLVVCQGTSTALGPPYDLHLDQVWHWGEQGTWGRSR